MDLARGGRQGGTMGTRDANAVLEERLEQLVEELMERDQPKSVRIRRMKELVALGERLPEAMVEDALERIMSHMLE